MKISDGAAKATFREAWPLETEVFSPFEGFGFWVRVQPVTRGIPGSPRIGTAGQRFWRTQPDALYARIGDSKIGPFVDCVAIEVCGSRDNFYSKRARYQPSLSALILEVGQRWVARAVKDRDRTAQIWRSLPFNQNNMCGVPVRYLSAVYAIDDDTFLEMRDDLTVRSQEFFVKQSSLTAITSPRMREFLSHMAPEARFHPPLQEW